MNERPTPESTRRPGIPTDPIVLADGRAWGFARPTPRLVPVVVAGADAFGRPEDTIGVQRTYGYPLEIRRHLDALRAVLDDGTEARQHEAFFTLAAALLRRAHDIDPATAAALLAVDVDDLQRLAEEVMLVALGGPPSPTTSTPAEAEHEPAETNS